MNVTVRPEGNPHIKVWRSVYWHHGIDMGDGTVIHFSGEPGRSVGAAVRRTPLDGFLRGGALRTVQHDQPLAAEEVRSRAARCLGRTGYSVLWGNCEHFARWCAAGRHESHQVRDALAGTFAIGFAILGTLARRQGMSLLGRAIPIVGPLSLGLMAANGLVDLLGYSVSPFDLSTLSPLRDGETSPLSPLSATERGNLNPPSRALEVG
jgi:hypothetical protein